MIETRKRKMDRVLDILSEKESVTSDELSLRIRGSYTGRISDLRGLGYIISCERIKAPGNELYRYRLVGKTNGSTKRRPILDKETAEEMAMLRIDLKFAESMLEDEKSKTKALILVSCLLAISTLSAIANALI